MSVMELSSPDEEVKVKAGAERQDALRHHLQAMVSEKLASRGISTKDLWRPRATASPQKLSKQEQERLERQRFNKRNWARKDRARSKELLEQLKETNGMLELENQKLKRQVDRLMDRKFHLKNVLVDHDCQLKRKQPSAGRGKEYNMTKSVKITGINCSVLHVTPARSCPSPPRGRSKQDLIGHTSPPSLASGTKTGFIRLDKKPSSMNTSQCAQQPPILKRCSQTVHNLTARPKAGRQFQKITPGPETACEDVEIKLPTTVFLDTDESQPFDTRNPEESGQSLASGGFDVSGLSDTSKSSLRLLMEYDHDVEVIEDLAQASKESKTRDEHSGAQREENKKRPHGTGHEEPESDGLKTVLLLPPAPFIQKWIKEEPGLEKGHRTHTPVWTSVTSPPAKPSMISTSEKRPADVQKLNLSEMRKTKQLPDKIYVSDLPQQSDVPSSKSAKGVTGKGALMERRFAQAHAKELMKKQIKLVTSLGSNTSTHTVINPWAVASSLMRDPNSASSSSFHPEPVDPHPSKATVTTRNHSGTGASQGAGISIVSETVSAAVSESSLLASISNTDVSATCEASTDSSTTVTAMSAPDTDNPGTVTDAQVLAAPDPEMSSEMSPGCLLHIAVGDLPMPSLTPEKHTLTRTSSWPNDLPPPQGRPAGRARSFSLPSSFSDIVFEATFTPERLPGVLWNPEDIGLACLSMWSVNRSDVGSEMTSPAPTLRIDPPDLAVQDLFSAPSVSLPLGSSPLLGIRPQTASKGKGKGKGNGRGKGKGRGRGRGSSMWPGTKSRHKGEGSLSEGCSDLEDGEVESSRVRVERVPDADIMLQALQEATFLS